MAPPRQARRTATTAPTAHHGPSRRTRSSGAEQPVSSSTTTQSQRARCSQEVIESSNQPPPHDSLLCDHCAVVIPMTSDHVSFSPCGHNLCFLCAISCLMNRGVKPVCCPVVGCVGKYSDSCKYFAARDEKRGIKNPHQSHNDYIKHNMPLLSMK